MIPSLDWLCQRAPDGIGWKFLTACYCSPSATKRSGRRHAEPKLNLGRFYWKDSVGPDPSTCGRRKVLPACAMTEPCPNGARTHTTRTLGLQPGKSGFPLGGLGPSWLYPLSQTDGGTGQETARPGFQNSISEARFQVTTYNNLPDQLRKIASRTTVNAKLVAVKQPAVRAARERNATISPEIPGLRFLGPVR